MWWAHGGRGWAGRLSRRAFPSFLSRSLSLALSLSPSPPPPSFFLSLFLSLSLDQSLFLGRPTLKISMLEEAMCEAVDTILLTHP